MSSSRSRTTRKVSSITVALVIGSLLVFSGLTSGAQAAKVPVLGWSPSTNGGFDFGTLDASTGQTGSQTFTLTNADGKSSGVVTIALSGSSTFTKTADNCAGKRLAPKKSCTVTARYAPTNNGSNAATLTASSQNAANATLSLTGASAWQNGDEMTNGQADWDSSSLLVTDFDSVYGSNFSFSVTVGLPNPGFSMTFGGPSYVEAFLPQSGAPGALDANLDNPTTSSSGVFGGDVLSLQLNVDFNDAGFLTGTSNLKFGDLTLCGFTTLSDLNGMSVRQFLDVVNTALGGGATTDSIASLQPVTASTNAAFVGGSPSTFAQTHLFPGTCPA